MSLDPIRMTEAITDSYLNYLLTTFRLRDRELQKQFEAALRVPDKFVKGPVLEATPPFDPGCSVETLVEEGLLSPHFRALRTETLPLDRPLYRHQEEGIRKAVARKRNIVVATGTGSGKTETFLIPILNHLFIEEANNALKPGVRALLLYPMNALANDQMARLRKLLKNYPAITFGRYTGETEQQQERAVRKYRQMFHREPNRNELISREQMRETPPHILLTNYAMLEYLLLRPDDHVFFDGAFADKWRFLVIDEAHTYTGAKGIEMAMLLRRLKDRVAGGEQGRLLCIATSATLGKGEEDFPDVVTFAEQLFGERFEWNTSDPLRQDVIKATRRYALDHGKEQWEPGGDLYVRWRNILGQPSAEGAIDALVTEGAGGGIPAKVLRIATAETRDQALEPFFYETLKGDKRLAALRIALEKEPRYLGDIAADVFGSTAEDRERLVALVDLAAQARPGSEDQSLLPARYHLFVRAIEGAYLSLRPKRLLYLERRESARFGEDIYAVFELAACRQCGATYLVGETRDVEGRTTLGQPGKKYLEEPGNLEFYLLLDEQVSRVPDDEDELVGYGGEEESELADVYILCAACGAIDRQNLLGPLCDCDAADYLSVIKASSKQGQVHSCLACGSRSPAGLVTRFLTGNDATASVLATAAYQELSVRDELLKDSVEQSITIEDGWSSTPVSLATKESAESREQEGRQLLVFSDSRQDAAFFAPYLSRTYSQILRRRLILKTIEDNRERVIENRWRVQDLANPLRQTANQQGLFSGMSKQEQESEVWKWLLYELMAMDRRNSLEGLGCLGFMLVKPEGWQAPRPLLGWGLSEDEAWLLFQILLGSFRTKGAVLFPDHVSPDDEFFSPRNREYYFLGKRPEKKRGAMRANIYGWNPTRKNDTNTRLDYLMRLTNSGLGRDLPKDECNYILSQIWHRSLALSDPASCWHEYFSAVTLSGGDVVYRIKPNFWALQAGTVDSSVRWYHCETCNSLTLLSLRGVCPTYQCSGQLQLCDPIEVFKDNHYRRLYSKVKPIKLVAEEHTAQLTSEAAAELQTRFIQGAVNVLSCSTTFELGVDVGELESVLMRNVPPSAANYVQRAGRAGRRTSSTAFALTFAQRRPHDLTYFNEPLRMVAGEIRPPYFEIANEKIIRRHMYATALAAYWKEHPETFGNVQAFFFKDGKSGPSLFAEFLSNRPDGLLVSLKRIVPPQLWDRLELEDWRWTDGLLDAEEGVLSVASASVVGDITNLEAARQQLYQANRPSDFIRYVINTIKREYLINFLSRQNVLPKYGFPVDVVNLQILHHADEAHGLELDRDLRIALSEYAPSSKVVAGGKLWTSRYLKRLPDRGWRKYRYAVCENCQSYQSVLADIEQPLDTCLSCRRPLEGRNRGTFVIPEFGFITSTRPPEKPGESRPQRTYASRTYYAGKSREFDRLSFQVGRVNLIAIPAVDGELAIINHAGYQGFKICQSCGYAVLGNDAAKNPHITPWRTECNGVLTRLFLGHEFKTDILQLRFEGYSADDRGFWLSLLYALLEGISEALDIDRQDLDGCLYPYAGDPSTPALVLFDDVPGGAGHVQRIARSETRLRRVIEVTLANLERCECGGEQRDTSCYGCLRNYRNQFCHDELKRGPVIDFLTDVMAVTAPAHS
jgi:hypothetical protein